MDDAADPLDRFWPAFDMQDPVVCAQETAWWPQGVLDYLAGAGLFAPTTPATQAACTSCPDGHVEEVESRRRADGTVAYFIWCPENGRVDVDAAHLRQWRPHFKLFARRVKEALNITGRVSDPVPDRLWRLGTTSWRGAPRLVYLARGLHWPDGEATASRVPADSRPIVLVGFHTPPPTLWPPSHPPVVPLGVVMSADAGGLSLDLALLGQWVANADEVAARRGEMTKAEIRRQVDRYAEKRYAEGGKSDVIKALHGQGQSSREIAAELKKRQMPLHHSNVARKKKTLVEEEPPATSRSIVRSRKAQPRDRKRRPIAGAQPEQEE